MDKNFTESPFGEVGFGAQKKKILAQYSQEKLSEEERV